MRERLLRFEIESDTTSATLLEPRGARALLVLAHGAGTTRRHESLVLLQRALGAEKIGSLLFNFACSEAGRRRPDPMPRLESAYSRALATARARHPERLLAGGRSMGGRVATHLAARGEPVDGLVLLGYPLHPAGKPEKLRAEHLPSIPVPSLFISGTRDRLATRELLEKAVASMKRARLVWIERADHGLDVRGRTRAEMAGEVAKLVSDWAP